MTFAPLANTCTSPEDLTTYRQALTAILNGLSWGYEPVMLQPIDTAGTLFAIDLALLGWDSEIWETMAAASPYAALVNLPASLTEKTGSRTPVLRGDWLARAATRAPLYYELLGLPDRLSAMLAGLKLDTATTGPNAARRLGIKTSAISRGNRLIERYPFANGAAWIASEFAPTAGRPDLFEATATPLPDGAAADNAPTVRPDATLLHFNLPNGFRAFFMANADGQRINDAPHSILLDTAKPGPRVSAGAACLSCHATEATALTSGSKDELLARIVASTQLSKEAKDRAASRHFTPESLTEAVKEDAARFVKANTEAGVDPARRTDRIAAIPALLNRYARPLSRDGFAAELGLSADAAELTALAPRASPSAQSILKRLAVGLVSRSDVEAVMPEILALLSGQTPQAAPSTPNAALSSTRAADTVEDIDLVLEPAKASFKVGELLSVTARTNRTCNLTLFTVDPNGRATVIYPNDFEQTNTLDAGRILKVPADNAPYQLRLGQKGRETIVGICSSTQKTVDGIRHDFERQRFTALGDYRAFLLRNWANGGDSGDSKPRARGRGAKPNADKAAERAAARADLQGRVALQIEVEAP